MDVGQAFKLINLDGSFYFLCLMSNIISNIYHFYNCPILEDSSKKHPFPCPTTYGIALTHYVDICTPVKSHVLRELANHTSDEKEKQRLLLMSASTEEGMVCGYGKGVLEMGWNMLIYLFCIFIIGVFVECVPEIHP